jgi:hypothetical protein
LTPAFKFVSFRMPVRHGHFLLVIWDTPFSDDPAIVAFE